MGPALRPHWRATGNDELALYMGLVAVKGDIHSVLPFLDPRNEERLEYNHHPT